jgi:spermidine synthase
MGGLSGRRKGVIAALFFGSGAAGLVYEVVWSKYLANLLGSAAEANAVVVATFMLGLALGARLFGAVADRTVRPLRLYAGLEVGVGAYALAFPKLFAGASALYLKVAPHIAEGFRGGPKLLVATALLLVPTMLMGGTLPALARYEAGRSHDIRRGLARLYAVNSIGAAIGAFVAGIRLVPLLGLWGSAACAAGLNIALGAAAFALSVNPTATEVAAGGAPALPGLVYGRAAVRAALWGAGLSGLTSFLCEVTWIRLLAVVLGGSTYNFTLALAAFILGIGLGSAWLALRRKEGDLLRLFGRLQVALAVSIAIAVPLYVRLPYAFSVAQASLARSPDTFSLYQAICFSFCLSVLVVPTFLMGAGFPAAARVVTSAVSEVGRGVGRLYLWNTAGSVLGATAGGLWLMPRIGMEGNFLAAMALSLSGAAVAFRWAPTAARRPALAWLAAGVLAVGMYAVAGRGWARFLSNGAQFREAQLRWDSFAAFRAEVDRDYSTRFYRDDPVASIAVSDFRGGEPRSLRINGKTDASTVGDIGTQILVGHYGALLHPRPVRRVLVVGLGSGMTVGSILAHDVERVDVVEISRAVADAAVLFGPWNRQALADPRCHVHVDDARTFLRTAREPYDLVISEPSNPWVAGEAGLFTQEFFRDAQRALAPDGLLVAWAHTYESDEAVVQLVTRTLRSVFPHCTTWLGGPDLIYVGSTQPLKIDPERIRSRLTPTVLADLHRVKADDVLVLLAEQAHSEEGQAEFAGSGEINTDDRNLLEYLAPIAFFIRTPGIWIKDERRSPSGGARLALPAYLAKHPMSAAEAQRLFQHLQDREPQHPLLRAAAASWRQLAPDDPKAAAAEARVSLAQRDASAAVSALEPFAARADLPPSIGALYLRARAAEAWLRRSVWFPDDLCALETMAQHIRPHAVEDPETAADLAEFDRAVDLAACQVP